MWKSRTNPIGFFCIDKMESLKMGSKRKTNIKETMNKQKVKAMKLLIDAMQGGKYLPSQVSAATNVLILLQNEGGE